MRTSLLSGIEDLKKLEADVELLSKSLYDKLSAMGRELLEAGDHAGYEEMLGMLPEGKCKNDLKKLSIKYALELVRGLREEYNKL